MACGEVVKATDAGVDAPPAPVSVTVLTTTGDGAPDPTAKVVFQDPDGKVVSDVAVDPSGHARAALPLGGTVSAIRIAAETSDTLAASITTAIGVKPGDDLTFGLKANATITSQGGQTTMSAMFTTEMGATNYSNATVEVIPTLDDPGSRRCADGRDHDQWWRSRFRAPQGSRVRSRSRGRVRSPSCDESSDMADYDNLAGYDELRQMPETLLTTTVGTMGAFVGMPFQRRIFTASARPTVP